MHELDENQSTMNNFMIGGGMEIDTLENVEQQINWTVGISPENVD